MAKHARKVTKKASGSIVEQCMLDYGVYVAEDRALNSMWDGLKPVQRRLLWTGWERLGMRPSGNNRACSRVVGDCVGCFLGDTRVPLLNGKVKTFEQLATDPSYKNTPFWVYSETDGCVVPGLAHSPRLTRYTKKLIEVTLDSGAVFRCTTDHLWKKLDGVYCQAKDLERGDALMPLSRRLGKGKWEGYEILKHPWKSAHGKGRTEVYTHRYVATYFGMLNEGEVAHHKDDNKRNNDPVNLEGKKASKHSSDHFEKNYDALVQKLRERARDPKVRRAKSKALKEYWASSRSDAAREKSKESWEKNVVPYTKTRKHREAKSKLLRERNADPEFQRKALAGKILKFAKGILDCGDSITKKTWDFYREKNKGKQPVKFATAITFFGSRKELIHSAKAYINDTVASVRVVRLSKKVPVFDLTVEGFHNFAIQTKKGKGVFVHNCFHPHGDSSGYQALVAMTHQRYPLFTGKGNFGNPTLDMPPAAYRYTSVFANGLMAEAFRDKVVAPLTPNYTGETQEPTVITSRLPLLLMNGSEGIAVAISSHIPPHNLEELTKVLKALAQKPTVRVKTLVTKYLKGPDYAEGAELRSSKDEVVELYKTGKGTLTFRCQHRIDQVKNGYTLVVTSGCPHWSLPTFTKKCDALAKQGFIRGVSNESGKGRIKVVVLAKQREALTNRVLPLITRKLRYNWVALQDRKPVQFNLITYCTEWLAWRHKVVEDHLKYQLKALRQRHLAETARLAVIENPDAFLKAVRAPTKPLTALVKALKLKHKSQAKVIVRSQIGLLTRKGAKKQQGLVADLVKNIEATKAKLRDIDAVVVGELDDLTKYWDARRTISNI